MTKLELHFQFEHAIGNQFCRLIVAIVSSAANLLAQLDEEDEALRLNALQSLNTVVHEFWFQIASSIASVEAFYEDEKFTHRELAALVASKVDLNAFRLCRRLLCQINLASLPSMCP